MTTPVVDENLSILQSQISAVVKTEKLAIKTEAEFFLVFRASIDRFASELRQEGAGVSISFRGIDFDLQKIVNPNFVPVTPSDRVLKNICNLLKLALEKEFLAAPVDICAGKFRAEFSLSADSEDRQLQVILTTDITQKSSKISFTSLTASRVFEMLSLPLEEAFPSLEIESFFDNPEIVNLMQVCRTAHLPSRKLVQIAPVTAAVAACAAIITIFTVKEPCSISAPSNLVGSSFGENEIIDHLRLLRSLKSLSSHESDACSVDSEVNRVLLNKNDQTFLWPEKVTGRISIADFLKLSKNKELVPAAKTVEVESELLKELQLSAAAFKPKQEIVEDFKIVDNLNEYQIHKLKILRDFVGEALNIEVPSAIFIFEGKGARGINLGKHGIGMHIELLDDSFDSALCTFLHEVAHNAEMSHSTRFIYILSKLTQAVSIRTWDVATRAAADKLTASDQRLLELKTAWEASARF